MTSTIYVLDTNIFIDAAQRYYSFDLVPGFWDKLIDLAKNRKIVSIDKVKEEIDNGKEKDSLRLWADNKFQEWFLSTEQPDVINAYREIIEWVAGQNQLLTKAKEEFASCADGWLIAYAKAYGYIVVTDETKDLKCRNRVKIPNVCLAFDIPYVNTFQMLRQLNVKM